MLYSFSLEADSSIHEMTVLDLNKVLNQPDKAGTETPDDVPSHNKPLS
jgi:hypothetical protein